MDITEAIKHAIDGNAVIIMGSGASYGAKNAFGDFPSGSGLAKTLYKKSGIEPDDENDLQDAAQCFEEQHSASALVSEIRSLLTCTSFTKTHETVYSLPWMRYYTTNYDDVALLAAKQHGISITPVTLSTPFSEKYNFEHLCIHINGYLGNLNENTIHDEFKLTSSSYSSEMNILNSRWGDYLFNDLETARSIVIVGLSLKYDLDLRKIIFKDNFVEKTVIISAPDLSENAQMQLKRYGKLYQIGVDEFASKINEVKTTYQPKAMLPTDVLYTAFTYDYNKATGSSLPTPEDVFQLFLNGHYCDSLFFKRDEYYYGLVRRSRFAEIRTAIINKTRFVFIQSDMGNGKTACIKELLYSLSRDNIHIFTLSNADSARINEEIKTIYQLAETKQVLVVVDDYTNYMEVLDKFAVYDNKKIQFVLTARTALNYNKMPSIINDFSVDEGCSKVFDINRLSHDDVLQCVQIFDQYGLFGRRASLSKKEKVKYLSNAKKNAGQFQTIMLDVIHSNIMQTKITDLIKLIKNESEQYHEAILLILLTKIMNLRLTTTDIERVLGMDIITDARFRSNPAIKELIILDNNELNVKSPITARYILQHVSDPHSIISSLCKVVSYAEKFADIPKYSNLLTAVVSYSHINSFLQEFKNPQQFLSTYYDELSNVAYYRQNNFFWLQYAISCIEIQRYDRAQKYLDTAYGLIPDGFVPFQINNQQARLYLERICHSQSSNAIDDFVAAHNLLIIPTVSPNDNEYNVVRLFGYYYRKKIQTVMLTEENLEVYQSACKEAYMRTSAFVKKNPVYNERLSGILSSLLSIYVQ